MFAGADQRLVSMWERWGVSMQELWAPSNDNSNAVTTTVLLQPSLLVDLAR